MTSPAMNNTACAPTNIPYPTLFGAEVLHVSASLVENFTRDVSDQLNYGHPSISVKGVDYCNVTVTYTHPGQNDTLNVETWLPMKDWNRRLQAVGGGGWVSGRFPLSYAAMAGAIGEGYAASTTDGGLIQSYAPDPWALNSPGNVNLYVLQDFASVALNDQSIIAKDLIKSFYGELPKYSYWSGCSQGGRQGLMLAQRYPDTYDGIAASSPAINWDQFIPATAWAQTMMSVMGEYPNNCEFRALTAAAIDTCDQLDGIIDGLISNPDACQFDPFSMVGQMVNCSSTGAPVTISKAAATIANATWTGPRTADGEFLWYGVNHEAPLVAQTLSEGPTADSGYATTRCSLDGTCEGVPTGLGEPWFQLFVKKDPSWNASLIESVDEYESLFKASVDQFKSILGTSFADLSAFRDLGGKLITYHGLADGSIPSKGTRDYYDRVTNITPNVHDYFRYFEVPGLGHCSGGVGGQPSATFQALVDWVENGEVPNTLPVFSNTNGTVNKKLLPYYPQKGSFLSEEPGAVSQKSIQDA